jgi:uncharacterized HAD superfamily protein
VDKEIVFLDLDGVLTNYPDAVKEYAKKIFNKEIINVLENTLTSEEFISMHRDPEFYKRMILIESVEIIKELQDKYNLILLTDRVINLNITNNWLSSQNLFFSHIYHRSLLGKKNMAKASNPLAIIDDDFKVIAKLVDFCKYPVHINRWQGKFINDKIISVNSLSEMIKEINNLNVSD